MDSAKILGYYHKEIFMEMKKKNIKNPYFFCFGNISNKTGYFYLYLQCRIVHFELIPISNSPWGNSLYRRTLIFNGIGVHTKIKENISSKYGFCIICVLQRQDNVFCFALWDRPTVCSNY